jgi:hypothetical protein
MDSNGYPEPNELLLIKKWPITNAFGLIDYIKDRWTYTSIRMKWGKDRVTKDTVLFLEFHTIGWSGNESLIEALLDNKPFSLMWYAKWERGGHYYFEIKPRSIGFKKVSQIVKEKGISRQSIHKAKHKYDWIDAGAKIKLCRHKNP